MWAATRRLTSCFQAGKRVAVFADLLNARVPFCRGGFCLPAHGAGSARARKWNSIGIAFEPKKEIADKGRRRREILSRMRGIYLNFLSYLSNKYYVLIHAAGFAMLSLAPVMDLDAPS
jgi:hypothetical protein